jgi:hypothetical protein
VLSLEYSPPPLPRSEHLGEVPGLTTALLSRQDIHVNVGRWQWRPTDEWPPLNAVLATPFWKADAYAEVRGRLQRPAPEMRLETGRQFHTLQLRGGTASLAQGDPLHAAEEEGDVGMPPDVEVCSLCGPHVLLGGWVCGRVGRHKVGGRGGVA